MIGLAGAIAAGRVPKLFAEDDARRARNGGSVAGGYFVLNFPGMLGAPVAFGQGVILYANRVPARASAAIRVLRSRRARTTTAFGSGARAASASSSSERLLGHATHDEESPRCDRRRAAGITSFDSSVCPR